MLATSIHRRRLDIAAHGALRMLEPRVGAIGDDLVALELGELFVGRVDDRAAGVMNSPR